MAQFTPAYSSLVKQLDEVETLRRLASESEKTDPIGASKEINALCRSAVVLLCAHLEAYVRELGDVTLDSIHAKAVPRNAVSTRFYYHLSKDLLSEVRDTADHSRIALKVFEFIERDLASWSRTGPFPDPLSSERFNQGFANPAFKKVKKYFNRFGFAEYQQEMGATLQAHYQTTVNMIDHLVDTRNKIAHGDPNASKTPAEVQEMTETVRRFCRVTDQVFANWCRDQLCAIR
ncbi:MAG: hypothetical protein DHS20C21_18770 [Gemmatimonadota bacterium]|nr:MAG: hypothetical protein DHS20C21_18770 [Gemmatimonadota bacterium]